MLNIVIGAYGGLSVVAGILQGLVKNIVWWSALILALGGGVMVSTIFLDGMVSVYAVTIGGLLIHISAIINNQRMHGEINKTHHFARFLGTVMLVVAQWMSLQA